MKSELKRFSVTPSVVPADCESTISIRALDGWMLFYDDVTYEVQIIPADKNELPMDEALSLKGIEKHRETLKVKPKNGVLELTHFFKGEQQWNIRIRTFEHDKHELITHQMNPKSFGWVMERPEQWSVVAVYSLKEDLYNRRALRGDLHIHTNMTDGDESPALVAAEYRSKGYDFAVITDHYFYDIGQYAREKFDFKTDFLLPVGEEIHNGFGGHLHIVNIGSSKSVNDVFRENPERIKKEVEALKEAVDVPENVDEQEYLYRVWVYLEAKRYGGLVIFPHPYWNIEKVRWHVGHEMSMAILKDGLCDAFEIMGGGNAEENNLQTALYYEAQRQGVNLPVVGSTDSHTVLWDGNEFKASTYVFTENSNIKKAVLEGYSVAVEHQPDEKNIRLYGPYRLVRYARFLTDYYFPLHNELCSSAGPVIRDYIQGDKTVKPLVEALEQRVTDFEKRFFGREKE